MPVFTALLRGINVGTANRIPMAELRALMTALGYRDVATALNSGNAVFRAAHGTPAGHAARLSNAIADTFDLNVPVIVKPVIELKRIVDENPLSGAESDASRFLVVLAPDRATLAGLSGITALLRPPERFEVGARAAYFHAASGIHGSKAAQALLGKGDRAVTSRNWATLCKLLSLAESLA